MNLENSVLHRSSEAKCPLFQWCLFTIIGNVAEINLHDLSLLRSMKKIILPQDSEIPKLIQEASVTLGK